MDSTQTGFEKFSTALLTLDSSSAGSHLISLSSASGISILAIEVLIKKMKDLNITGNDSAAIHQTKQHLGKLFHMKDLGPLTGIEVFRSPGMHLTQQKYAMECFTGCPV